MGTKLVRRKGLSSQFIPRPSEAKARDQRSSLREMTGSHRPVRASRVLPMIPSLRYAQGRDKLSGLVAIALLLALTACRQEAKKRVIASPAGPQVRATVILAVTLLATLPVLEPYKPNLFLESTTALPSAIQRIQAGAIAGRTPRDGTQALKKPDR